jgi:hypothetical protein
VSDDTQLADLNHGANVLSAVGSRSWLYVMSPYEYPSRLV